MSWWNSKHGDDPNHVTSVQSTLKAGGGITCAAASVQNCGSFVADVQKWSYAPYRDSHQSTVRFRPGQAQPGLQSTSLARTPGQPPEPGSQKPDNCFQIHAAIGHSIRPGTVIVSCDNSKIKHGGLNI